MFSKIDQIGIIGGGALGKAVSKALTDSNTKVLCYDRKPELRNVETVGELAQKCNVILLCVPSWAIREVAEQITGSGVALSGKLIITLSKGVEQEFITMDKVLQQVLDGSADYGVMYGPTFADEIADGLGGYAVVSLSNKIWFDMIEPIFDRAGLHLTYNDDMRAVVTCGVLKNIYALAFGICDGAKWGMNFKGHLAALIIHEMRSILESLDLTGDAICSDVGIGDLVTTGMSEKSFNHHAGVLIAQGTNPGDLKSEGLVSLLNIPSIIDIQKFPVINALYAIAFRKAELKKLKEL